MIRCLLFEQFENRISRRGGMADAPDSKSGGGNIVWVRVPSSAYSFPDSKWSGKFFIVRPDFRISTARAADHRQKSLHTEFITVYRLFLSFYKSLYNCSYFLAELSHEKSAAMPRSTILFHSRLWL